MSVINQVLITAIMSYMCTTLGIMYTWPSSTYSLFGSTNTTLNRVMTNSELSLLGSLSSFAALIITPFSGYILDWLGRKKLFIFLFMLQVGSWLIIVCSNKVEAILTAVFLTGLNGCIILIIPMFVCEICQDSIRGSMSAFAVTFFGIGTLISYLLGGFLEYYTMNYVCLVLTIIGLFMLTYVKESPVFLMMKSMEKEAAASIAFYRRKDVNSEIVVNEINQIKKTLNTTVDDITTPEEEKLRGDKPKQKISQWEFLKRSRSTRNALYVCLVLSASAIFQGLIVVQVYAEPLFKEAVPSMTPLASSVLFATVAVTAGFIGAYLVDVIGRKYLMIYSSIATGIFCVVLGTQIQINWGPSWLTAVFMHLYCLTYCLGAGNVPFIYIAEVFLPEIKSFASVATLEWALICNFIVLVIFNPIVTTFGLGVIFYMFVVSCFLSAVFCTIFQRETKGLSVEAIQAQFLKRSRL